MLAIVSEIVNIAHYIHMYIQFHIHGVDWKTWSEGWTNPATAEGPKQRNSNAFEQYQNRSEQKLKINERIVERAD